MLKNQNSNQTLEVNRFRFTFWNITEIRTFVSIREENSNEAITKIKQSSQHLKFLPFQNKSKMSEIEKHLTFHWDTSNSEPSSERGNFFIYRCFKLKILLQLFTFDV